MVLEADDEVICISEPFIMPDRAAHPAPARRAALTHGKAKELKPAATVRVKGGTALEMVVQGPAPLRCRVV